MQNKPNFKKSQMNVNLYNTANYENISDWTLGENKPNSNPIKPNFQKAKMIVNAFITKDYRKKDDFSVRINKPNSNPIPRMSKMNVNSLITKDYRKNDTFAAKKTNPIQTQSCPPQADSKGRPLMDSRNYKKYLTLPLGADRICCLPEIICCNRNNEKGFQTCL